MGSEMCIRDSSYGGQYLNNYGRSNTKVAGYSANDNDWYLFAPETGYFVTAEKAGTTTVVIGGVTYEIVVTETVTECKHENTERVGVKDPTCTEPGSTGTVSYTHLTLPTKRIV